MDDQTGSKVIAKRGPGVYLIQRAYSQVQVADTHQGIVFPPKNIDAIIARGYWETCDDVEAADVLDAVTPTPSR
jgi:hypothetical protein